MVIVFLAVLVGHAWIRSNYPRRVSQLFSAAFNIRLMRQLMREELALSHRGSIVLTAAFLLIFSLAIYLTMKFFNWTFLPFEGGLAYLAILGTITVIYLLKSIWIGLLRWIMQGDFSLSEYNFNIYLFFKILGIILIPLTLLLALTPALVYEPETQQIQSSVVHQSMLFMTLGVMVIAYILRLMRGVTNALQHGVSLIYIIFYLCTLEFLPVALSIKLMNS